MIKNSNMLLRIAQGDVYGMSCEFDDTNLQEALNFNGYIKHPKWGPELGCYTDDTQMSIAVSNCLLKSDNPTTEEFADEFVSCFKRDERPGYAKGFQLFLESVADGKEFLEKINPDSKKNGAAMRSVPIGFLKTVDQVNEVAEKQAKITHNTKSGIISSRVVALRSWYSLHCDGDLCDIQSWLAGELKTDMIPLWYGGRVKGEEIGLYTASAVMTLLMQEKGLYGIAKKTLKMGGDTDSVMSIAWGIASARFVEAIPNFFYDELESGEYGRDFLISLGHNLCYKYS